MRRTTYHEKVQFDSEANSSILIKGQAKNASVRASSYREYNDREIKEPTMYNSLSPVLKNQTQLTNQR